MDRRAFIGTLAGGLLAAPLAAEAQQAAKVARIGYLATNLVANPHLPEAFRQGLRDLGYVEGRNVVIEYRSAEGIERIPALAAELVALKVDVIFVGGSTRVTLAAMQATKTIPIVFTGVGDPVTSGLVTNLARPGGNVTGLSGLGPELVGKCLELLTQAVPGVSRVAVLSRPGALGERTDKDMLKGVEVTGRALGVRLQFVEARGRGPEDFDRSFSDMTRARAGALTVLPSNMFTTSADASWPWRPRTGSRQCTHRGSLWMPGALCPMERTLLMCFGAPRPTWTRFSRVRSPVTCPSNSQRRSSWSSTSRLRRPSA